MSAAIQCTRRPRLVTSESVAGNVPPVEEAGKAGGGCQSDAAYRRVARCGKAGEPATRCGWGRESRHFAIPATGRG